MYAQWCVSVYPRVLSVIDVMKENKRHGKIAAMDQVEIK